MNKDRKLLAFGTGACMAVVLAFGVSRLRAYPPHEDEVLALFLGRDSLGGMLDTVLTERGGAPLHYLLAWVIVHLGGGLDALRLVSLACAVASIPVMALLAERLVGPRRALAATVLACASWVFLFHAVFGRMYALFLLTATASLLALASRRWAWWFAATLAMVAAHPYGTLLLAAQLVYLLAARMRAAMPWAAGIVLAAAPLWYAYAVLADRYSEGNGPKSTIDFLREAAGDLTSGYLVALAAFLVLAIVGATRVRPSPALTTAVGAVVAALVLAAITDASPESRHLVFVLPVLAALVAGGLPGRAAVAVPLVAALVAVEVAWAWHRTPELFEGESAAEVESREDAGNWLARVGRPDDILHGFHPFFLAAWERNDDFPTSVVPRADADLALEALRTAPDGHAIFVIERSGPQPASIPPSAFDDLENRGFGRYLILRSKTPVPTAREYLELALDAAGIGQILGDPAGGVNFDTAKLALARVADQETRSSRSTASR
jgi:hypothetical protein